MSELERSGAELLKTLAIGWRVTIFRMNNWGLVQVPAIPKRTLIDEHFFLIAINHATIAEVLLHCIDAIFGLFIQSIIDVEDKFSIALYLLLWTAT